MEMLQFLEFKIFVFAALAFAFESNHPVFPNELQLAMILSIAVMPPALHSANVVPV